MNSRLNKLKNSSRDSFISLAIHELRTPLTSLNGYIHLLGKSKLNSKQLGWITQLEKEATRLTLVTEELIAINKRSDEDLKFNFRQHELNGFTKQAINRFKLVNKKRKIKLEQGFKENSLSITSDEKKLSQMLSNILVTVDKFCTTDGKITINLKNSLKNVEIRVLFDTYKKTSREDIKKQSSDDLLALLKFETGMLFVKHVVNTHKGELSFSYDKSRVCVLVSLPL